MASSRQRIVVATTDLQCFWSDAGTNR